MAKIKEKAHDEAEAAKDRPQADELHSLVDRGFAVIRPYLKPIAIGVGVLVVVVAAGSVWSSAQEKKAGKATAELGKVLDAAGARVEAGTPDFAAMAAGREPEPARFKTFKDRSEAELAATQALEASYGGTKVATRAKLIAAGALYDLGKYDDALAAYGAFLASGPPADVAGVAHEGVGYALEAKALAAKDAAARGAGLDEAAKAFKEMASGDKDDKSPQAALSLYHQGRILAQKGDKDGAIDLYRKVLDKNPGAALTGEVNARLGLLGAPPAPPAPAAGAPAAPAAPVPAAPADPSAAPAAPAAPAPAAPAPK